MAVFLGLGFWWGLPLVAAHPDRGPHRCEPAAAAGGGRTVGRAASTRAGLPSRFWVFAAFALLYGVVETTNGNWATLYMTNDLGASATLASLALTTFWAMVTVGRILFAAIERQFPETRTYRLLPFVAAAAMVADRGAAGRRRDGRACWRSAWPGSAARRSCR